jgi:hypothetical protein
MYVCFPGAGSAAFSRRRFNAKTEDTDFKISHGACRNSMEKQVLLMT